MKAYYYCRNKIACIEIYSFEWGIVISAYSSFSKSPLIDLSFYYVSFPVGIMLENTIKAGIYII